MKNFFVLVGLAVVLSGCQTIKMPAGPDVAALQPLADAPRLVANVMDSRGDEKIGTIGATTIKALKLETVAAGKNYLHQFLHAQGANPAFAPSFNSTKVEEIKKLVGSERADGALLFEIHSLTVKSIDLILDPPDYQIKGTVYLFSPEGELMFNQDVEAKLNSMSSSTKGQGEVVGQLLNDSLWSLEQSPRFKDQLKALKPAAAVPSAA